ncbi:hypothetical protein [Lysobacter sp. GCM10012299]|uniref:hypothetical protein n=1 Tax=Lysobacter sp. GCM10012299 TaxID=3317333 RepID=UPI00360914A2
MFVLQCLDVASLWVIWWCAANCLGAAPEGRTWKLVSLKLALWVVSVSAFVGAITLFVEAQPIRWWASGLLYGIAVVALWIYDYRLGVIRQWRLLRDWLRSVPECLRDRLRRRSP